MEVYPKDVNRSRHAIQMARIGKPSLINTAALARCKGVGREQELFEQFHVIGMKPLKRLIGAGGWRHRAEATVLMRGRLPVA